MNPYLAWLMARLAEPSTWLGIAAFGASTGSALAAAGFEKVGLVVGAIGAGFGGVGAFITKENPAPPPHTGASA
jgi:hypothetical protein